LGNETIPVRHHSVSHGYQLGQVQVMMRIEWSTERGISGARKLRLETEARRILDHNVDALKGLHEMAEDANTAAAAVI